jgi:hypothetical protein
MRTDACGATAISFTGEEGLYLSGSVSPALGDVIVTVLKADGSVLRTGKTTSTGQVWVCMYMFVCIFV